MKTTYSLYEISLVFYLLLKKYIIHKPLYNKHLCYKSLITLLIQIVPQASGCWLVKRFQMNLNYLQVHLKHMQETENQFRYFYITFQVVELSRQPNIWLFKIWRNQQYTKSNSVPQKNSINLLDHTEKSVSTLLLNAAHPHSEIW